jgi:serine/threonine-protein kinase
MLARGERPSYGKLCGVAAPGAAGVGKNMKPRTESARNTIGVNATSIDATSSNAISFGYVSDVARPGRIIAGRHRLQGPLHDGSNRKGTAGAYGSSLWRADAIWGGHPVMVELLDPAIAEDRSLADVFLSEARAASAVSSPFVSRVLAFGIEASTPYLITELAGFDFRLGDTLASRIAARRLPSFSELARLFHELAQGVHAMHSLGLLHRDLRSERVTLLCTPQPSGGERESPKLSFGISKLMNDTLELVRTMARRAVAPSATPQYASPEQVLGTASLEPASDVWSLAVIAFESVTGQLPFAGATIGERLVQICAGPARVPSELAPVPRGFDAWFARGVEKAPADRWRSVREMADALLELAAARRR